MSIQDPIANLFSSINNAQGRKKETVKVPSSTKNTLFAFPPVVDAGIAKLALPDKVPTTFM